MHAGAFAQALAADAPVEHPTLHLGRAAARLHGEGGVGKATREPLLFFDSEGVTSGFRNWFC